MTFQFPSPGDTTVADMSIHDMTYEELKPLPIPNIVTTFLDLLSG